MTPRASDLLRWLDQAGLGEAETVYDPELNRRLDPFRVTHPIPLICAGAKCKTRIAHWALSSEGARVVPGPKRKPRRDDIAGEYRSSVRDRDLGGVAPGTLMVGGEADLIFPGFVGEGHFHPAIEWAMNGDGAITLDTNPTIGAGWPLRWRFTCPRCGRSYQYTNRAMLRQMLGAINARRDYIRAGKIR
jgi:hypothetical protein